ncbi:MAG: ATP-binding protein [Bdellovibrionales bacterium]|nr:ATP-binding protein [Bdellovibrionales bacterium]
MDQFLNIPKNTLLTALDKYNPWWKDHSYVSPFLQTRGYFNSFKKLVLDSNIQRTIILMGPRRVGKTVMLNQLVSKALKNNQFSPKNIFFISVDDPLYNKTSLEELLNLFQDTSLNHQKNVKKLVIFDEIQYLKNWENHLKVLTDKYPNIKFVASGSSAAVLKRKSDESGAGRFTDFFLPALTFKEFIDFSNKTRRNDINELNKEFINYINFGGYPEPILNKEIQTNIRKFIGQDIIDKVLLRDLPNLYGIQDIQELNSLLTMTAFNSAREINLEELSKRSHIAKNTILKYLQYLEASFLIKRVYRIDDTGKHLQRARHFKVYLANPSMYPALFGKIHENSDNIGNIVETAIFSQYFHSTYFLKNFHYARWKTNSQEREVDMVLVDAHYKPNVLLEIKWSDRHYKNPNTLKGLISMAIKNKLKEVLVTSKTKQGQMTYKNIKIIFIPCVVLCKDVGNFLLEEGGINRDLLLSYK